MVYILPQSSMEKLEGVHPILVDLVLRCLSHIPIRVVYGVRSQAEQARLFNEGLSKTMNSYHLVQADGYGYAVDLAPHPIDWDNTKKFYWFGGMMKVLGDLYLPPEYYLRWGGNWDSDEDLDDQTFMDLVHFELRKRDG